MQKIGLVFAGLGVTAGAGALILFFLNAFVWAVLAAWVGSAAAVSGAGLIGLALSLNAERSADAPGEAGPA